MTFRKKFVDHYHWLAALDIAILQKPAFFESPANCLKISRGHLAIQRVVILAGQERRRAFDNISVRVANRSERDVRPKPDVLDAWKHSRAIQNVPVERS